MRILLVSTYELGHQPLHVASPAAALLAAGHDVSCTDLSVEPWDPSVLDGVDALAVSVPMHTAMRLAIQVAERAREVDPDLPICLYGLYAGNSHDMTVGSIVNRVISGEYEPALLSWVARLASGETEDSYADGGSTTEDDDPARIVHTGRGHFRVPARHLLPPLEKYARLAVGGTERLVGYVEASHGCAFSCKHCPVPAVYGGRIRIVDADTVLADIDQLVDTGATHISFGDPDFLNGAQHSRRIVAAMHERHPDLTFDCTTKVELILRYRDLWPEFAEAGCLFVISAFETVNEDILTILDKGHDRSDMVEATSILRNNGIEVRPSLMPFTPWTTLEDLVELIDFVGEQDLIGNVDPVHYSIRLLVPEDSLLLDSPAMTPHLGEYRAEALSYEWTPIDPRTDVLQGQLAQIVENAAAEGTPIAITYGRVRSAVRQAAGLCCDTAVMDEAMIAASQDRPRLTEAWFCCAEPTDMQLESLR